MDADKLPHLLSNTYYLTIPSTNASNGSDESRCSHVKIRWSGYVVYQSHSR